MPGASISLGPTGQSDATTGHPTAIASIKDFPRPSMREGNAKTVDLDNEFKGVLLKSQEEHVALDTELKGEAGKSTLQFSVTYKNKSTGSLLPHQGKCLHKIDLILLKSEST